MIGGGAGEAKDEQRSIERGVRRSGQRWLTWGRVGLRDLLAGLVASIVLVANIVSFAALMFPGEFADGIPIAIWAMLVGSSVGGIWIAWATSLPPLSTGIDSPTGAFLVLLSASTASAVVAAGSSNESAIVTVMIVFTAATLMSGALLYLIGVLRWGTYFRFIPFFVVGGFLIATGGFLVAGGIRMVTGMPLTLDNVVTQWTWGSMAKLATAVMVLAVLLTIRRWTRSPLAMPLALFVMWAVGAGALFVLGLGSFRYGWYLPSLGTLTPWLPFDAMGATHFTWRVVVDLLPEFVAVTLVALLSLVTKVSSLEVARQVPGDLDREFRAHGVANVAIVPLGGIACSLQTGTSLLLRNAGGATRLSGVVCSLVLGAVALANLDLPGLIPIPIIAGLVLYLGYTFIADVCRGLLRQRAWTDLLLAAVIGFLCMYSGYLIGVLAGLLGACVLFALNYARLGVVRRHATRRSFAGFVDRSAEASDYLLIAGDAIQIYWLNGYIFFGSSEGLFERVRADVEALPGGRVAYVILDFATVAGADSSAVASLAKLTNACERRGITLVYSALSRANQAVLEQGGLIGARSRHKAFIDVNHALAWCEDRLLTEAKVHIGMRLEGFEEWLQESLGDAVRAEDAIEYLERKDTSDSEVLYHAGEPADTIDLVAVGNLAIDVARTNGERLRVRRFMRHTMLGEMGFVRRSVRAATVMSTGPATVFTLTRESFERMRAERPDIAAAFDDFIMRTLADRVDTANRTVAGLSA